MVSLNTQSREVSYSADRVSTGEAIAHYYPFFDLRLVNFLVSIPPVPWLVNKNILREAMQGSLPEAIRTRPKKVFKAPNEYSQVMREMVFVWIDDLLKNTPVLEEYVDTAGLRSFLQSGEISQAKVFGLERTLASAYWLRSREENTQSTSANLRIEIAGVQGVRGKADVK